MSVPIIDKRFLPKNQSAGSRDKFIDRYKKEIKQRVKDIINQESIKDVIKGEKKIKIKKDNLDEPEFGFEQGTGKTEKVLIGNKKFNRGDKVPRPDGGGQSKGGGKNGQGDEDDFEFILTEKEFSDLFFEDLELPDLTKNEFLGINWEIQHAGYSKSGGPSALNIKRTMLNALYRRLAIRGLRKTDDDNSDRRIPFVDDVDLRYNFKEKLDIPATKAVMFLLMDVSGSMGSKQKDLAKRFYILLNMFLRRNYDIVDLVFIRHTETAQEVDENTFFYDRQSGGTIISSGYEKISEIIHSRYNPEQWNIYIAQASDGDNYEDDNDRMEEILLKNLLPNTQYMAYIDVQNEDYGFINSAHKSDAYTILSKVSKSHSNLQVREIKSYSEIINVFRSLFKKKGAK